MLETVAKIITSVRYQIRETTASYWTDAEITTYINEAQEKISTETKCLSKYYTHDLEADDIVNDREVRFYSDFIALDEGGVTYEGKPLVQTSLKELDEHGGTGWRDVTGTPTRFYFRSDYIGFFPKPTAGDTVAYYGIERATALSGSTVPLSSDYRTVAFRCYLRDYAVAMCWYAKSEDTKGDRFMAFFNKGIYNINAILNGHKNQGAKMIPEYRSRGHRYGINYGDTAHYID